MSIETMKQALEALEWLTSAEPGNEPPVNAAITALRTAIAEAEKQEPVAWMYKCTADNSDPVLLREKQNWAKSGTGLWVETPLYPPPAAQRERVVFPTMLRKMWSGGEVQAWLDENVNGIKGEV
jgi:hypothetical protein